MEQDNPWQMEQLDRCLHHVLVHEGIKANLKGEVETDQNF